MIFGPLAEFLQGGIGIHVGTRDRQLRPNGARALAVRVDPDGVHFEVFLATVAAARLMPDLESNGQAAVVFGRPTDDRACQVKGVFAGARGAQEDERALVRTQWNGYLDQLDAIGIARAAPANWVTWPATVIRLKATAVFEQTPGPQAGTQLT